MKSFRNFVRYTFSKEQGRELCILSVLVCLIGVLFYNLYPFPFLYPDTGAYVLAAQSNRLNIFRPMGYSHYLQFLHNINGSITFVFIASYTLHALVSLFCLYSFKYLSDLKNRWLFYGLCLFVFLSPTLLFSTNFLMSDGLFCTLTVLFVTTALWMCYSPNIWITLIHLCSLILLYKVRYAGMFYVPVSIVVLFLTYRKKLALRLTIACIPLVLLVFLQSGTKREYKKATGVNTTSGFGGWQLINNASVLIPMAKQMPSEKFGTETERLCHNFLSTYPDSIFTTKTALSTNLMWVASYPLKQFLAYYMQLTGRPYYKAWPEVGQIYSNYAKKIILAHPFAFTGRFLIPSFISFFQFWEISEHKIAFQNDKLFQDYFGIETDSYKHNCNLFTQINPLRHVLHYIYWIALAAAVLVFFISIRKNCFSREEKQALFLLLLFMVLYISISALASPSATWRYAMPMYVPSLLFMGYVLNGLLTKKSPGKER